MEVNLPMHVHADKHNYCAQFALCMHANLELNLMQNIPFCMHRCVLAADGLTRSNCSINRINAVVDQDGLTLIAEGAKGSGSIVR